MTAKEKAKELVDKYIKLYPSYVVMWKGDIEEAEKNIKKGALIAVDEILDLHLGLSNCDENNWEIEKFYKEVKKEIEKL
jgi:hypothetical protein